MLKGESQPGEGNFPAMRDRLWRGYDLRAMLPAVVLAAIISLDLLVARWLSEDLSFLAEQVGLLSLYIPLAAVWGLLLGVGCYRVVTYTYRLTDRALLVDRGFRWLPEPPIPLGEIDQVSHHGRWPTRWLNVGSVTVRTRTGRQVVLTGIYSPASFAEAIRTQALHAQCPTPEMNQATQPI